MGPARFLCCFAPIAETAAADCQAVKLPAGASKQETRTVEEKPGYEKPTDDLILNLLDHDGGPASGMPYKVHYLGPPRPPCEANREATVKGLAREFELMPEDQEITSILKLVKSMFRAPVALVALFDSKRVFVAEEEGGVIPRGDFPWRWALCAWSLAYNHAQILVIPDTLQDARFRENEKVTGFPHVRFYCGSPLVASNGHRLGTLCFADVAPRPQFDAASCVVMNNLSEVIVRHMEKGIALRLKQQDNDKLQATYGNLQRTLDAFDHCLVLLDTSAEGWRVLHANAMFAKVTGVERGAAIGALLSDLFVGFQGLALPNPELVRAAKQCLDFQVSSCTLKQRPENDSSVGMGTKGSKALVTRNFVLTFRPAAREGLDDDAIPIGVPAFCKPNTVSTSSPASQANPLANASRSYYFMTIEKPNQAGKTRSSVGSSSLLTLGSTINSVEGLVEGLELGHLLGRGSFGSVYYGSWHGTPVAVKLIDHDLAGATPSSVDGVALEAILSKELRHPNIVQTLKYAHRKTLRAHGGTTSIAEGSTFDAPTCCTAGSGITGTTGQTCSTATGFGSRSTAAFMAANEGNYSDGELVTKHEPSAHKRSSIDMPVPEDAAMDSAHPSGANLWPVIEFNADDPATALLSMDWPAVGSSVGHTQTGLSVKSGKHASVHDTTENSVASQTWLLLEYCDRGSLQEAIDRGWLRTERSALKGGPNMLAVVQTMLEVSRAICYLHSQNVVHGDLSTWNVMLCSGGVQAELGDRRFVAKVCDFGLSRSLNMASRITTHTYGTLTHMPPETLLHGTITTSVDVYAVGVLLWQTYTSSRPWSGLTHAQIIHLVASQGASLVFPEDTPKAFSTLAMACMARDQEARPSMEQVVKTLGAILEAFKQGQGISSADL